LRRTRLSIVTSSPAATAVPPMATRPIHAPPATGRTDLVTTVAVDGADVGAASPGGGVGAGTRLL